MEVKIHKFDTHKFISRIDNPDIEQCLEDFIECMESQRVTPVTDFKIVEVERYGEVEALWLTCRGVSLTKKQYEDEVLREQVRRCMLGPIATGFSFKDCR